MRLWQDLEGFAGLIGQISRRQELVEHDSGALARLHRELEDAEGLVPDDLRGVLESLTGLDPELDAHVAEGTRAVAAWLPIVARLHRARGAAPPSADPLEPTAEPSSAEARQGQAR